MTKKEKIHPCEYGSWSFLKNSDKVNIELKENMVVCYGNESHPEGLMMESSKETSKSHGFKSNFLCVNAGYVEEGQ